MDISFAKEVLRVEAEAVGRLASRIGDNFLRAAEIIFRCKERGGRVVVSGVGKAGIVGRKIAATMSSTGTPAVFLSPTDALHGDLGIVSRHDAALILSNSGTTEELLRLIPYLRRIGAKIISVTGDGDSLLAQPEISDEVIVMGKIEEPCPLGLAPSASTTAMLAIGDALALTVQKERGFKGEDYARFHPAGELGRKLMKVRDAMRTEERCPLVSPDTLVGDVLVAISNARAGSAPVVDENRRLIGILTDGDFRRAFAANPDVAKVSVSKVMTRNPKAIGAERLLGEAMALMRDKKINELPVLDCNGAVVGLLDIQDIVGVKIE